MNDLRPAVNSWSALRRVAILPELPGRIARSLSLRVRMMLLFSSVVAVLLVLSYVAFYWLLARNVQTQIDAQLLNAANPLAQNWTKNSSNEYHDVQELDLPNEYFEILDTLRHIEVKSKNLRREPLQLCPHWLSASGPIYCTLKEGPRGLLRTVVVPYRHGTHRRFLAVAMPSQDADYVLDSFRRMALLTLPLSLLLIALVSGWYVGRSLRPVAELTERAAQMADRLSGHAPAPVMAPLTVINPNDEVGRLAETFNRLGERVTSVLRQLRQFVSDASHELRTPLTILRGETELILAEPRRPEEYQETLRVIDGELKNLSHIVQGLFTLSMADAGELRLSKEPLYLNEVLEETCALVAPLAESKGIEIERKIGHEVSYRGDEAFLRQLFLIFLDNSIKYSPSQTRVRVGLDRVNGSVHITFKDEGMGIPAQHLSRIFERFYRAAPSSVAETSSGGLGLAIAKAIVTAHGGSIDCASKSGAGSTFTVSLPLSGSSNGSPTNH
ncbi:MAG: sensor histidine kinase [Terriglobia bacterium]